MAINGKKMGIAGRFRGLLPVVVDVETSGLNPATDAVLEIAIATIKMDERGKLYKDETVAYHIEPFYTAHIDPESLEINKIDLEQPLRYAIPEQQALHNIFSKIDTLLKETGCQRAVLVGHNAWFDLAFLLTAAKRCQMSSVPFHSFTTFDTATLSAFRFGETVLAKAVKCAGIYFDINKAHSAIYDVEQTAELFCFIMNRG